MVTDISDKINKAIGMHSLWKQILTDSCYTGKYDFDPKLIRLDTECEFGRWFYTQIPKEYSELEYYDRIKTLHAQFHIEAGNILDLIIAGNLVEARKSLEFGRKYATISGNLITNLLEWRNSFYNLK